VINLQEFLDKLVTTHMLAQNITLEGGAKTLHTSKTAAF
jgi:hypothetical protein